MAKKLIVIAGPTASGKTSLAIQVAQQYKTEILSADSRQCYTELGVAVAKPTLEELDLVPHHFINSHSIHKPISAGAYERFGLNILNELFKQNDIVVCVGGTGLYIKALCHGLDDMPKENEEIKKRLDIEFTQKGIEWLQEVVKKEDKEFYQAIDHQNPMRLLRALIFKRSTGESIVTYQKKKAAKRGFEIESYAIEMEREILYERINKRVDAMLENGLIEEAKALYPLKGLTALNTVGYQELFNAFDGICTQEEAITKIKQHTRNYAKRQITWFKHQGDFNNANTLIQ